MDWPAILLTTFWLQNNKNNIIQTNEMIIFNFCQQNYFVQQELNNTIWKGTIELDSNQRISTVFIWVLFPFHNNPETLVIL